MNSYVYTVEIEGVTKYCLSILPTEIIFKKGLHRAAIVGFLKTEHIEPDDFIENKDFKEFFHQIVAKHLPKQADFLAEGKKTGTGYVYLIDKRMKNPKGDVPMQDIIGVMNFENGLLVADSYLPNTNYRLCTTKGLFQLPSPLENMLIDELRKFS